MFSYFVYTTETYYNIHRFRYILNTVAALVRVRRRQKESINNDMFNLESKNKGNNL